MQVWLLSASYPLMGVPMLKHCHQARRSAGAQLAGIAQHEVASCFIDKLTANIQGGAQKFRGVTFFASKASHGLQIIDSDGWYVMDMQKRILHKNRSPVHEADTFVIFDEARCR
jgi:hypothetical protein